MIARFKGSKDEVFIEDPASIMLENKTVKDINKPIVQILNSERRIVTEIKFTTVDIRPGDKLYFTIGCITDG